MLFCWRNHKLKYDPYYVVVLSFLVSNSALAAAADDGLSYLCYSVFDTAVHRVVAFSAGNASILSTATTAVYPLHFARPCPIRMLPGLRPERQVSWDKRHVSCPYFLLVNDMYSSVEFKIIHIYKAPQDGQVTDGTLKQQ